MKKITELRQQDLDENYQPRSEMVYEDRYASRAVLEDDSGRIALMHVQKRDYYKLPGGGVEPGESAEQALHRELLEEVGATGRIESEIGVVEEWRDDKKMLGVSRAYYVKVIGIVGEPHFTDHEIADGFAVEWVPSINDAIEKVSRAYTREDLGIRFMARRDAAILQAHRLDVESAGL